MRHPKGADITVRASCLWAKRPTRPTRPTEPLSKAGDHRCPLTDRGNERKAVHLSYYTPTDIFQQRDMKDKQLSFTEAVVAMITIPLALVIGSILLSKKKR